MSFAFFSGEPYSDTKASTIYLYPRDKRTTVIDDYGY